MKWLSLQTAYALIAAGLALGSLSSAGAQTAAAPAPKPAATPDPRFGAWKAVTAPAPGPTHILGGYSLGCIVGAKELPMTNPDYIVMRPDERRNFGHPDMIKYLNDLGKMLRIDGLPPMQVEDISGPRGGPVAKGHASHQNGLDVDISFVMTRKPLTTEERNSFGPSFVIDRKVLKPEWSDLQTALVAHAAFAANVNRIFVAPAIKKLFCEKFPNEPWLYKIRPYWGHDDHLHVRLNCPAGEPKCKVQAPLDPKNKGCGDELTWWFSKEADRAAQSGKEHLALGIPKVYPAMPSACEVVRAM